MISRHNLIGDEWVAGTPSVNINPSDLDDTIRLCDQACAEQVQPVIEEAALALPAWSRLPFQIRADLLDRVSRQLLARRDEAADAPAREEGMTCSDAQNEVKRAAQVFPFVAAGVYRLRSKLIPSVRDGVDVRIRVSRSAWSRSSRRGNSPSPFGCGRLRQHSLVETRWC